MTHARSYTSGEDAGPAGGGPYGDTSVTAASIVVVVA